MSLKRLGSLCRFDQFAVPLNEVFRRDDGAALPGQVDLRPGEADATAGTIRDTFGRITTPVLAGPGQALVLEVPAEAGDDAVVNLEPLGRVPDAMSTAYRTSDGSGVLRIATNALAPGNYGAWLRRGAEPPHRAPLPVRVLPPAQVGPDAPGVEIVGARGAGVLGIREGSNLLVRYCRPSGAAAADSWIGIFPVGTPADQLTRDNANASSYWLKAPGGPRGQPCGAAMAFSAELVPGQDYQLLLMHDGVNGSTQAVGHNASFVLTPALP